MRITAWSILVMNPKPTGVPASTIQRVRPSATAPPEAKAGRTQHGSWGRPGTIRASLPAGGTGAGDSVGAAASPPGASAARYAPASIPVPSGDQTFGGG